MRMMSLDVLVVALDPHAREDQRRPPRRRRARRACTSSAGRCRSRPGGPSPHAVNTCAPSTNTGTRIVWSAGCVLPRNGSLCRNASPSRRSGCSSRIERVCRPGAEHVHLQALGGGEQLVVGGDDAAGEVARHVEDAPSARCGTACWSSRARSLSKRLASTAISDGSSRRGHLAAGRRPRRSRRGQTWSIVVAGVGDVRVAAGVRRRWSSARWMSAGPSSSPPGGSVAPS